MVTNDLSTSEVKRLIYSYRPTGITDELYSFGSVLLGEVQRRADQVDSKSATVIGWATGILAFLLTEVARTGGILNVLVVLGSGGCALMAIILSFAALRTQDGWLWPSDRDWFEETALTSADELKRFHLRCMHEVRQKHKTLLERKTRHLSWGQKFLVWGAGFLACGIVVRLLFMEFPALVVFLKSIEVRLGIA